MSIEVTGEGKNTGATSTGTGMIIGKNGEGLAAIARPFLIGYNNDLFEIKQRQQLYLVDSQPTARNKSVFPRPELLHAEGSHVVARKVEVRLRGMGMVRRGAGVTESRYINQATVGIHGDFN
jgi:hypothetical protein